MQCLFCPEEEFLDILELYSDTREFDIETCCEGLHSAVVEEMQGWDRKRWQHFFQESAGVDVRQILEGKPSLVVDFGLEVVPVKQAVAKQFINEHHRHNAAPPGWKFGAGLKNGPDLMAVVWVGRPVSRVMQARGYLEINRVCVQETFPRGLTWNACSQLYGWACREAKRRGYARILTYTWEDEPGTSLRAAGFQEVARVRAKSWSCPSRGRKEQRRARKIRWEKELMPLVHHEPVVK